MSSDDESNFSGDPFASFNSFDDFPGLALNRSGLSKYFKRVFGILPVSSSFVDIFCKNSNTSASKISFFNDSFAFIVKSYSGSSRCLYDSIKEHAPWSSPVKFLSVSNLYSNNYLGYIKLNYPTSISSSDELNYTELSSVAPYLNTVKVYPFFISDLSLLLFSLRRLPFYVSDSIPITERFKYLNLLSFRIDPNLELAVAKSEISFELVLCLLRPFWYSCLDKIKVTISSIQKPIKSSFILLDYPKVSCKYISEGDIQKKVLWLKLNDSRHILNSPFFKSLKTTVLYLSKFKFEDYKDGSILVLIIDQYIDEIKKKKVLLKVLLDKFRFLSLTDPVGFGTKNSGIFPSRVMIVCPYALEYLFDEDEISLIFNLVAYQDMDQTLDFILNNNMDLPYLENTLNSGMRYYFNI